MLTSNSLYRDHSVAKNFSASDPWENQLSMGWCSTWSVSSMGTGFLTETLKGSSGCSEAQRDAKCDQEPQGSTWVLLRSQSGERGVEKLCGNKRVTKSLLVWQTPGNLGSIVGAYDGPNWCSKHLQPCLRHPRKAVKLNICSQGMQSALWETCCFWDLQWSLVYCIGMLKTGTQGMYLFLYQQMLYAYVR